MQRFIAFFSSFFLSSLLFAQTTAVPVRVVGESIVVTADRIAEPIAEATDSVSVITAADLRRSQVATVSEALRDIAGISIVRSGSPGHTTSAFLRGASPSQVLLLIDGVEINDPFFGGADIASLMISGVERIEIVRGAQSPLYGSQAMSGVINIVTAPFSSATAGVDGVVIAEGGSLSTHSESLQLYAGSDSLHWKLGGSRFDTEGQFENDEFRNVQLNGRLQWSSPAGSAVALYAFAGDSHVGIPFNGREPRLDREGDSSLALGGADYTLHGSPRLNLEIRASVTRRDDAFRDPDDRYSQSSAHDSTLLRAMAQNTMNLGSHAVTFGFEQKQEDVVATSNGLPALDETIHTTAVYAQNKLSAGALMVSAGARLDRHSRFGIHTSPRLSAAYQGNERWRVRAAAGKAFRAPTAGELAYPYYGNPSLGPESSLSYEAGVDFRAGRSTVSLTGFSNSYRALISFDPVTFIAANIDHALIRGAELSAAVHVADSWRIDFAGTHLLTRDGETGLPLYRRPRNAASVTLSYAHSAWSASANVNVTGRRFERDFETYSDRYNGGYFKADAAVSRRLRANLLLTARLENLFDRRYVEALAFPAPGRTFHGGLRFGF